MEVKIGAPDIGITTHNEWFEGLTYDGSAPIQGTQCDIEGPGYGGGLSFLHIDISLLQIITDTSDHDNSID
ncbi:MAG: hypothetical protein KAJ35_09590, partial [Thermoplasmata archaeon]|nr:hypothetical protein [Thermoplasmata archaeon]